MPWLYISSQLAVYPASFSLMMSVAGRGGPLLARLKARGFGPTPDRRIAVDGRGAPCSSLQSESDLDIDFCCCCQTFFFLTNLRAHAVTTCTELDLHACTRDLQLADVVVRRELVEMIRESRGQTCRSGSHVHMHVQQPAPGTSSDRLCCQSHIKWLPADHVICSHCTVSAASCDRRCTRVPQSFNLVPWW